MPIVSRNIKLLFDSRPGSRIRYARQYFISPSVITKWCAGTGTDIGICDAFRIAVFFGVDLNWLTTLHTERALNYEYEQ